MRLGILGDLNDLAAVYIGWLARQRGAEVHELDEAELGNTWSFGLEVPHPEGGTLRSREGAMRLGDLDGVFVRFNPQPALPSGVRLEGVHYHMFVMERREALHQLLEVLPCPVVNRASAGRSNASKPYQMALLEAAGLLVPRWIATNDRTAAIDFLTSCPGGAIYKASSGLRSRVRKADAVLLERLGAGSPPIVIQEYIPGIDVRVHTVRDRTFACAVASAGVDYRFETDGNQYRPTEVPAALGRLCCEFAASEGLLLAGFDFRLTVRDEWYCLEANPVPSFLPYEMSSGLEIGSAIVDLFDSETTGVAGQLS